jgi:hypothetical protein
MKTTKELIIADITAKVEAKLASQKVELGVVQDIISSVQSIQTKNNNAFELIDKTKMIYKESLLLSKDAQNKIDKLKQVVKDLGIELTIRDLSLIERVKSLNSVATNNLAKLNQATNPSSTIK